MTNQLLKEEKPSLLKTIATHPATIFIIGTMVGAFLWKQGIIQKFTGKLFSKKNSTDGED